MVLGRIQDAILGKPTLEGPSRVPNYFPVQPRGCEKHAGNLFECIAKEATEKAKDMEKAGLHQSYFPDVKAVATNENAAKKVQEISKQNNLTDNTLPKVGDNPLDECRDFIAYYKRCCDRELKKKRNWILTEPYRVQEEYRYKNETN